MTNIGHLPNELDPGKCTCRAVIETPKGSRNKFKYDIETKMFKLGGLLPEGMSFPFDFGFIPSTVGGDGDPLDILVLMDAPACVGCLIDVRIVGLICAEQSEDGETEENDRLLGVAIHSYNHQNIRSLSELDSHILDQIEMFFVSYNKQRGKKFRVTGTGGPKKGIKAVQKGMRDAKKEAKKGVKK
jgi:inorganic pyrophosphatase